MRKLMYVICFVTAACFFTTIYYASYVYSIKNNNSDNIKLVQNNDSEEDTISSRVVNSLEQPILVEDAICIIENYNITGDVIKENEYKVPLEFVGMTREDVIEYITNYTNTLNKEEKELIKYELLSFANNKIVIRKSFKTQEDATYVYWIIETAGEVCVYKADKETIYIRTGIKIEDIPETERIFIKDGIFITGVQQLFNYLESCTS